MWGETLPLLITPTIEVHKVTIGPQTKCSLHKHRYKWNGFYVISGTLIIEVHKNDYDLVDKTTLVAGEFTTVKPSEFHRFANPGPDQVQALEIYYLEPLSEDIIRAGCGGPYDPTDEDYKYEEIPEDD